MHSDSGSTDSFWNLTADIPADGLIEPGERVKVGVVGADIGGMTTAFLAAREGRSVIVLDDGPSGGGESGRTTGRGLQAHAGWSRVVAAVILMGMLILGTLMSGSGGGLFRSPLALLLVDGGCYGLWALWCGFV